MSKKKVSFSFDGDAKPLENMTEDGYFCSLVSQGGKEPSLLSNLVADEQIIAPKELLDFVRFMCDVWYKTSNWVYEKVDADAFMSYPIIQGTHNQIALGIIAKQPYDASKIRKAVDWLIDNPPLVMPQKNEATK